MRLHKREVTDIDELKSIVEACRTVRIGAADGEGMFIVPMSFGFEWDAEDAGSGAPHLTLWLHSAAEGRKSEAFSAGGADGVPVAIEMDCEDGVITGPYACQYSFAFRSIMGSGRIYPVASGEDKVFGLTKIMEHLAPKAPVAFGPGIIERTSVWRIEVDRFTGKRRAPKAAAVEPTTAPKQP
ncbi:pyridoxamine 5'-phosphate oxidase family protein [Enorma burkinafasonensis]|uniref:pyridoxamine 5'-phosphate oxidase family protein n=1 Tax=Enorma burkinafasonensis TaxID=2590867 RepID=UPI001C94085B|nr:pyridoxamine 5'-phosphate oxidase family protein [Enorma burkinafasonensis]